MPRQFVACEFKPGGRTYTYHNDGAEVFPGDRVRAQGRNGWQALTVVSVTDEAPEFETNPILGRVEDGPPVPDEPNTAPNTI